MPTYTVHDAKTNLSKLIEQAGLLGGQHRDPFDRILAAQSIQEKLTLVSNDGALRELAPDMIW